MRAQTGSEELLIAKLFFEKVAPLNGGSKVNTTLSDLSLVVYLRPSGKRVQWITRARGLIGRRKKRPPVVFLLPFIPLVRKSHER